MGWGGCFASSSRSKDKPSRWKSSDGFVGDRFHVTWLARRASLLDSVWDFFFGGGGEGPAFFVFF